MSAKKEVKKAKKVVLNEYLIVSDEDGNDFFTVKAKNPKDAAVKALEELGWWIAEN